MILDIVKYGNPVLRARGKKIGAITPEIEQLASDMLETMHDNAGVGLAGQQIGRAIQLTVIDVREAGRPSTLEVDGKEVPPESMMPLVLINPVVSEPTGEQIGVEGCLSFPEISAEIKRAEGVRVEATNLKGERFQFHCTGLLARAAQHEVDHLNGVLFIDRMDSATKASLSGRLKRLQKETKSELAAR
ncbi:MAG: peptide deformylase [Verrucomicrobiae bacterium]|nr:peptide deformylase [Verrucomicrobiae bacterium]